MALSDVCQLYIEQSIDAELAAGVKPHSAAKDLQEQIEKVFAKRIPFETLKARAYRRLKEKEKRCKSTVADVRPKPPIIGSVARLHKLLEAGHKKSLEHGVDPSPEEINALSELHDNLTIYLKTFSEELD